MAPHGGPEAGERGRTFSETFDFAFDGVIASFEGLAGSAVLGVALALLFSDNLVWN
ncbi:MAG: hypothetical protein WKF43_05610 [Acidimicrobiales bacterium]